METLVVAVVTAIASVLASSGFWAYMQKKSEKNSASNKMLVGLGHDRILELGMKYIERGSITHDEYENLVDYLYEPYKALGGNGAAERVIKEVGKLKVTNKPEPTWPEIERRKQNVQQ